jgi:hypothetical protein
VFCVPNHRFPQALSVRKFLTKIGLPRLGRAYSRFFNRIARHAHTDAPEIWKERLTRAGFVLEQSWDYFPPDALRVLEWGHPLGLPSLFSKKLFGRWILIPTRWNLAVPCIGLVNLWITPGLQKVCVHFSLRGDLHEEPERVAVLRQILVGNPGLV